MISHQAVAEAFSTHRFADVYDCLSDDTVWAVPGQSALVGRGTVVAACEATLASLRQTEVTVLRFLVVAAQHAVAVDSVTQYADPDGSVSVVSSSDFYEFAGDTLVAITSYAVELAAPLESNAYIGAV